MQPIIRTRMASVISGATALVLAFGLAQVSANSQAGDLTGRIVGHVRVHKTGADNFDEPSSPCYRARTHKGVTNFLGVRPIWRSCPWLVYPSNSTAFCTGNVDNTCPKMTDTRWRRWAHNKAVGHGWLLPPDDPESKYWAKVVFSAPKLLYTRTGRTWGFTRTKVDRLGPLRPRTMLDQPRSYALQVSGGVSQCAAIKRRAASDQVTWVIARDRRSRGGFNPSFSTWQGEWLSRRWNSGRLYGFGTRGPRLAIKAAATTQSVILTARNGVQSQRMTKVTFQRWQLHCPLD